MYEAFFHLSRTPFTRGLPPEQLLSTPAMEEAGARLDYAARERRLRRTHRRRRARANPPRCAPSWPACPSPATRRST